MQRLDVSGAVRPIYGSLGVKRLISVLESNIIYSYFAFISSILYIYIERERERDRVAYVSFVQLDL